MPNYPAPGWNAEHAAVWRQVALDGLAAQFPRAARYLAAHTHPRLIAAIEAAEARVEATYAAADPEAFAAALAALASVLDNLQVPPFLSWA